MGALYEDMNRIGLRFAMAAMARNKLVTFVTFLLLIIAIIFIQTHPHSVWYYFFACMFTSKMLGLIFEKTSMGYMITNRLLNMGIKL